MKPMRKDLSRSQSTKPIKIVAILPRSLISLGILIGIAAGLALWANAQQPVLKITNLGANNFAITITNGLPSTNYTLFWTPALENPAYPWEVITVSDIGQTNFWLDMGEWQAAWFRVLVGSDQDGDGSPEWQDAQPLNPAVGILSITIDSPTNGMVLP